MSFIVAALLGHCFVTANQNLIRYVPPLFYPVTIGNAADTIEIGHQRSELWTLLSLIRCSNNYYDTRKLHMRYDMK